MERQRRTLNGYVTIKLTEEEQASFYSQVSKTDNWIGWAYEHRFVVEKDLGEKLPDFVVVHHMDGNRKNNHISNLLPVYGQAAHRRIHAWIDFGARMDESYEKVDIRNNRNSIGEQNTCLSCGKPTTERRNKYCSVSCASQAQNDTIREKKGIKVERPSSDDLLSLLKHNSFVQVGKMFNVSDNAVRKWCRKYGIDTKSVKV